MQEEYINEFINQDFNEFSNWLSTLNPYEFTFVAVLIGFLISPTLTINQQNSLGNFFELLGQIILTVNAQSITAKQNIKKKSGIRQELEKITLEEEIINLKREVIQLRKDVFK